MNILSVCKDPDILSVMIIVKVIIQIIRISVPIILIVSAMLDYMKATKENDELAKTSKLIVRKVVAALLVFLIPTFVNLIGNLFNNNYYKDCIANATQESIDTARYEQAKQKVDKAYESLSESEYNLAMNYVIKIKNDSLKNELENRLKEIKNYISLKKEILSLKGLDGAKLREKYKELYEKVDKIKDEHIKEVLMELLLQYGVGRPLNVEPGLHTDKTYGAMRYHEVVPPHPTTNMALWIFLHGDGGLSTGGFTNNVASGKLYDYYEEFFYIAPSPIPFRQDWSGGNIPSNLKALIDHVVEEYQIDKDRIIISGFSRGAIGTWTMVNNYPDLFSVAFPISCRPVGVNAKNFKTTVVRAHAGDVHGPAGNYEGDYADAMKSFVEKIKKAGGDATMTIYPGKKHGEVNGVLNQRETVEFALKTTKKR